MEEVFIILLIAGFLIWLVVGPIIAMVKARDAMKEARHARDELQDTLSRINELEMKMRASVSSIEPAVRPIALPTGPPTPPPPVAENPALERVLERIEQEKAGSESEAPAPPPIPARRKLVNFGDTETPVPPPLPVEPAEPFSLERFMGVKLFAWLGGVAMFFGVIFFVKYAFENNLIPPSLRIILGFITGTALLIGGLATHRLAKYRVLAQAFCATGVLILYGVSFAAHAIYHFPAFGMVPTFVLMAVITFTAFLIAVRLNALVVAVLGMLGGFMTPVLLDTGTDQVFGLFGYIALLDIGLLAVSRHGRWRFLTACAAVGTALMEAGWYHGFFARGAYFEGTKTLIPMGIQLFFIALFLAGGWFRRRRIGRHAAASVVGLVAVAMWFAFLMLQFGPVAGRHFLLYGFILLLNLAVIVLAISRPRFGPAQVAAAGFTFLHLAVWTTHHLTAANLNPALGMFLFFGALHAVMPVILARRSPRYAAGITTKAGPWMGPVVLLMMLIPLLVNPLPHAIWLAILIANLMMIALAIVTRKVVPVLVSAVLVMGIAAVWLVSVPSNDRSLVWLLGIAATVPLVFVTAGLRLALTLKTRGEGVSADGLAAAMLPAVSGLLPFALLVLAMLRLPVAIPSPVFGVALLLATVLAGLAIHGKQGQLVLAALAGTLLVEAVWHSHHYQPVSPVIPLLWYLGFHGFYLAFPFVFRKRTAELSHPWIAAALSGIGHFLLVYDLVKTAYRNDLMGLVPAGFAVPALILLALAWRMFPGMDERQRSRLAWSGGAALLFITLIFPIQFERQWITVSWAIEGALLLWLHRRVPHPGLQGTGLALLVISFVRLTLNPAVFNDYPRGGTPVLNWHLYTYGLVAAAHFLGGHWFTKSAIGEIALHARGVLFALGGVLLFVLLNLEIADYFTPREEAAVAFRFGGNFARDMTCSIAWGLFSLGLLGMGFWKRSKHARFAAVGLLVVTLLKVFLHDLAAVQNIFRIGALIGVAVIAFVASFLYQRFFDRPKP